MRWYGGDDDDDESGMIERNEKKTDRERERLTSVYYIEF